MSARAETVVMKKISHAANIFMLGAWMFLVPSVLIYRCYEWLKYGEWPTISLLTLGADVPQVKWIGLQKLLIELCDAGIEISSAVIFLCVAAILALFAKES